MSDDQATQDAAAPTPTAIGSTSDAASPAKPADGADTTTASDDPQPQRTEKVAVVSAAPPSTAPPPPRQMSREEFLRQMGLAPDDVADGPPPSSGAKTTAVALSGPPAPVPPRLAGDAPEVMQDDQWVRSTVFADVTLVGPGAVDLVTNEAKKAIMETFKASRSGGAGTMTVDHEGGAVIMSSTSSVDERRAADLVSQEDHDMATDYKASLLEEFRKRKKCGEAKVPPPASPQRRRPEAAAS